MKVHAHFNDINEAIRQVLLKSTHSISIAVAWFTDKELINLLAVKAAEGVRVSIIISNTVLNNNPELAFEALLCAGGCLYLVGDESQLMHHKFCVVDYRTTITGSYNWTGQAQNNLENIVVIEDHETAVNYTVAMDKLLTDATIKCVVKNQAQLIVAKAEALQSLGLDVDINAMAATL